jgi:hypothetical protein
VRAGRTHRPVRAGRTLVEEGTPDFPKRPCPGGRWRQNRPAAHPAAVGRDDPPRLDQQQGEDGALPRTAEGHRPVGVPDLQRPEQVKPHGPS